MLFLGTISWKGVSCFNRGVCFSDGRGFILKEGGGAPWVGIVGFGGGGGFKKNRKMGGAPSPCPPHYGKPCMKKICVST